METTLVVDRERRDGVGDRLVLDGRRRSCATRRIDPGAAERMRVVRLVALTALDLVPVASWLVLRGKCRHCGVRIGPEPIVIELANTTLFVLFGLKFGAHAVLPAYWCLGAALVALVWIDLHEFRLPREITYTAFVHQRDPA